MIYILMAAYNEEHDLPGLLEAIQNQNWPWEYKIILVNDGSTDVTQSIADKFKEKLPIQTLIHQYNQGLGRALSTGFNKILKNSLNDNDIIITMDSDGTHPLDLVKVLKEKIDSGLDVVIASRFCRGGRQNGVPLYRRSLSRTASILLTMLKPVTGVRDYTSGYRAFSGRIINEMSKSYKDSFVTEKGFAATLEILLKASKHTNRIAEVPLFLRYDKKAGISKMKIISTIYSYILLLLKTP